MFRYPTSIKNSGEKSIPREQPNQNKDPVLLSLFMRDNEKFNISHAPTPITGLSGIQFSILNSQTYTIRK